LFVDIVIVLSLCYCGIAVILICTIHCLGWAVQTTSVA